MLINPIDAQYEWEYISFCILKILVGMYFHYFKTSDIVDFLYLLEFGYDWVLQSTQWELYGSVLHFSWYGMEYCDYINVMEVNAQHNVLQVLI